MTEQCAALVVETPKSIRRDLCGARFGQLLVIGFSKWSYPKNSDRTPVWLCKCDCGVVKDILGKSLVSRATISCGCYLKKKVTTHMATKTAAYVSYWAAKSRCNCKANGSYSYYGGKGIKFLLPSFEEFLAVMGQPKKGESLDRIDSNGHYSLDNIKWSSASQQANNKSNTLMLTVNGLTKPLSHWLTGAMANERRLIQNRLLRGWCDNCAVLVPKSGGNCLHKKRKS